MIEANQTFDETGGETIMLLGCLIYRQNELSDAQNQNKSFKCVSMNEDEIDKTLPEDISDKQNLTNDNDKNPIQEWFKKYDLYYPQFNWFIEKHFFILNVMMQHWRQKGKRKMQRRWLN